MSQFGPALPPHLAAARAAAAAQDEELDVDMEDDSDDSDDEAVVEPASAPADIPSLEQQLESDPSSYEILAALVVAYRQANQTDKLLATRQRLQQLFPLPQKVWQEWLNDAEAAATTSELKETVIGLYQLAVKDYMVPDLWVRYIEFLMTLNQETFDDATTNRVRSVCDTALSVVGEHASEGHKVWDVCRRFEKELLIQFDEQELKDQANAQRIRLQKLYERELALPIRDISRAHNDYQTDIGAVPERLSKVYIAARKAFDQREPFEDSIQRIADENLGPLGTCTDEYVAAWREYLAFETKESAKKRPTAVQSLHERMLVHCFLRVECWEAYVKFLFHHLNDKATIKLVCERATRNCPYAVSLWRWLLFASENTGATPAEMEAVRQRAPSSPELNLELSLCIAQYYRRKISEQGKVDEKSELVTGFRDAMARSGDAAAAIAVPAAGYVFDSSSAVYRVYTFYTKTEQTVFQNVERTRQIFIDWCNNKESFNLAALQKFIDFEATQRNFSEISRLYRNIINKMPADWVTYSWCNAWLQFERESGTADSIIAAEVRCATRMAEIEAHQANVAAKAAEQAAEQQLEEERIKEARRQKQIDKKHKARDKKKATKAATRASGKRPRDDETVDSSSSKKWTWGSGKDRERDPADTAGAMPLDPNEHDKDAEQEEDDEANNQREPPPKRSKRESSATEHTDATPMEVDQSESGAAHKNGAGVIVEAEDDLHARTAFVLNLSFEVDEDALRDKFKEFGSISHIKLPRERGKPRGFAYIEFADKASVDQAINVYNGTMWQGRKLQVQHSKPRNSRPGSSSASGVEARTVYVKNIKKGTMNVETLLKDKFSPCGEVEEVRLGLDHVGNFKGFAYVQFKNESSIPAALKAETTIDDGETQSILLIERCRERRKGAEREKTAEPETPAEQESKRRAALQLMPRVVKRATNKAAPTAPSSSSAPSSTPVGSTSSGASPKLSAAPSSWSSSFVASSDAYSSISPASKASSSVKAAASTKSPLVGPVSSAPAATTSTASSAESSSTSTTKSNADFRALFMKR